MGKRVANDVGESFWAIITSPQARKTQVVLIGILLSAATAGLLPPDVAVWIILIVNALTAAGVYKVPNAQPVAALTFKSTEFRGDVKG